MKNAISPTPEHYIYPGEFVPLLKEPHIKKSLRKSFEESSIVNAPVILAESDDTVKVDICMPGLKREELVVYADNNILSICVAQVKPGLSAQPKNKSLASSCDFFYRSIGLPANVDPEFISAEYKSDMLSLCISKINHPIKKRHTRIAVY